MNFGTRDGAVCEAARVRLRRRHRQAPWRIRACACRGCRGGSARTTTMAALRPWANEKHRYLLAVFMCRPLCAPRCLLLMSRVLQQHARLRYRNIDWHEAQRWHNTVMYLERVRARTRTIWDDRPLPYNIVITMYLCQDRAWTRLISSYVGISSNNYISCSD